MYISKGFTDFPVNVYFTTQRRFFLVKGDKMKIASLKRVLHSTERIQLM